VRAPAGGRAEASDEQRQEVRSRDGSVAKLVARLVYEALDRPAREHAVELVGELVDRCHQPAAHEWTQFVVVHDHLRNEDSARRVSIDKRDFNR
jgi:hypothetical protein